MALIKITPQLMHGKGVTDLPDVPGLTTSEMQARFDELSREVIAPTFNANVDTLLAESATQEIGAAVPQGVRAEPQPQQGQPTKLAGVLQGIVNFCKEFVQGFSYSKSETDAQINAKIIEIGTGDMAKSVYDTNSDGVVDNAEYATLAGNAQVATTAQKANTAMSADNGYFTYAHAKSGTTHTLTGTGANIKFTATANFVQGDTFTVNSVVYTALNQNNRPLGTGAFMIGKTVCAMLSGTVLVITNANAVPYTIWKGTAIQGAVIQLSEPMEHKQRRYRLNTPNRIINGGDSWGNIDAIGEVSIRAYLFGTANTSTNVTLDMSNNRKTLTVRLLTETPTYPMTEIQEVF